MTYNLNIIDTPGFRDTKGKATDQSTINRIGQLFSENGDTGIPFLDAVCVIVKASDTLLTVSHQYIFRSISFIFGKDIVSNICILITFADGSDAPVISSLQKSNLQSGPTFSFNNSSLFAENKTNISSFSQMFWEMNNTSFKDLFNEIRHFKTRSLSQTKEKIEERDQLKNNNY